MKVNAELLSVLKEVFNLTDGPWDDPVISEDLYDRMEKAIKNAEEQKENE